MSSSRERKTKDTSEEGRPLLSATEFSNNSRSGSSSSSESPDSFQEESESIDSTTLNYEGSSTVANQLKATTENILLEKQRKLDKYTTKRNAAQSRLDALADEKSNPNNRRLKHAGRVGIANMATGFTIGGMLTTLYSVVEKFKAGPSPVPPPFNFIIFPVLGILGLITAGLSIAEAVLNPTRSNIANAIFNSGDGLITAGIIAASLALPAVIIPIIPYVFMGIMSVQLAKKLFEAGKAIYRHSKEVDPKKKSGLKQLIGIHLTGATSFGLGITSVGVVMLFAHFLLAPIGIAAGVFLSGFMGVLMAKTLYNKHKQAKLKAKEESELPKEIQTLDSKINTLKAAIKNTTTQTNKLFSEKMERTAMNEVRQATERGRILDAADNNARGMYGVELEEARATTDKLQELTKTQASTVVTQRGVIHQQKEMIDKLNGTIKHQNGTIDKLESALSATLDKLNLFAPKLEQTAANMEQTLSAGHQATLTS